METECAKVGLRLNAKKTDVITNNILPDHPPLMTTGGTALKEVIDFKYLGSWVNSSEQDLKPSLQKSLDGCYIRMLRVVLKSNQNEHVTNKRLYGEALRVSKKVAVRRMRLAGHCQRHLELPASKLVLWEPTHGHRSRGRPTLTYVDVLRKDVGAETTEELAGCMEDRENWKHRWRTRLTMT
ncbi:hypothetical protein SKAU_G00354120 [Synaphobranchus kaupii]|uniref:Reverse transcriptase n=1 Tax=Synaphobranchus kaupii TaxID=118154 RepID=A0A9Q1IGF5_SYNKA|nr:hypothetical protein SKAU_G00354120 [Synaphobranchus kaupii]